MNEEDVYFIDAMRDTKDRPKQSLYKDLKHIS